MHCVHVEMTIPTGGATIQMLGNGNKWQTYLVCLQATVSQMALLVEEI